MPSTSQFDKQSQTYKDKVLPPEITHRMSIEMGSTLSWYKYVGFDGITVGIDHFGSSGDATQMIKDFGFDAEEIVEKYLREFN